MKKVSAFSVFKGKKEKGDTPTIDRNSSKRASLKKASSEPVINGDDDSRSKKLLRAIKGGSFRNTVRGNKHRPTHLGDGTGNSPFVAGDGAEVKLTAVKGKNKTGAADNTSVSGTPALPKKAKKSITPKSAELTKISKQKKNLPPLPVSGFSETPRSSTHLTNEEAASAGRSKGKRELDDTSPSSSMSKKKRVESPIKQAPIQAVNPQRKDKLNKRKLMPNAVLETVYDSTEEARKLFECMIHPVQADKFFKELWQKKPLLVRRHISNYNDGWFSAEELDKILEKDHIEFGVNLDVTSYKDGKRETHNPPGRAYRSVVWDYYQNGCSVRMLNPQTYSKNVWKMLATLQEYFGCCVGANVYLTPPGTQGFAPHYDDIEAFILQLEGKKHWRLYNPRTEQETLPRDSSGNFDQSEIGSPILDVTLEAGDLLYFPRGTIHQGYALEDAHSLHITFSCYQKNTWGDLFQKLIPRALEIAIDEDVEFREGLPVDYLHYTGVVNSDIESSKRDSFTQKISSLLTKMIQNYCPIDAACDQLGKQFIRDSLPPVFSEMEKSCSVHGHGERWDPISQAVKGNTEMEPDTMIKLIRKGCLRLVTEDDAIRVYHNIENARVYHGREPQYIEVTADLAPAVEFLIHNYPEYVSVDSLPAPSVEERVEISSILYDKGLLITGRKQEEPESDEEDCSDIDVEHVDDSSMDEDECTEGNYNPSTSRNGQGETGMTETLEGGSSGLCSREEHVKMCTPYIQKDSGSVGAEAESRILQFPVPVELFSAEQIRQMMPGQSQDLLPAKQIQEQVLADIIKEMTRAQSQNMLTAKQIPDRASDEQVRGMTPDQCRNMSPARQIQDMVSTEKIKDQYQNMLAAEQIQGIVQADQMKRLTPDQCQNMVTAKQILDQVSKEQVRGMTPDQCQNMSPARQIQDMVSTEKIIGRKPDQSEKILPAKQIQDMFSAEQIRGTTLCQNMLPTKKIRDLFSAEQIKGMTPGQIQDMFPAKQIKDVIPIEQNGRLSPVEKIQDTVQAKQNNSVLQADHIKKLEAAGQSASVVCPEQIQELIPAEQNALPAEQHWDTAKAQGNGTILSAEQNRGTSVKEQSKDMNQEKQIKDMTTLKVERVSVDRDEIVRKKSPDMFETPREIKVEIVYPENFCSKNESGLLSSPEEGLYTCKLCFFKTKYEGSLTRHMSFVHDKQNMPLFKCDTCDFETTNKHTLRRHYRLVHPETCGISTTKMPKCDMCGECVSTEEDLDRHKKEAHDYTVVEYKCDDCAFVSKRHDCLTKHQRIIHGKMEFICCWKCSRSFYKRTDYKEHKCMAKSAHVRCHICNNYLSSPKCLQTHIKLHTEQNSFNCKICNKSFMYRYQLQFHQNAVHENVDVQYSCGLCSSSFLHKANLTRHIKHVHLADSKTGSSYTSSDKTGSSYTSSDKTGSSYTSSDKTGSSYTSSDKTGSSYTCSDKTGSKQEEDSTGGVPKEKLKLKSFKCPNCTSTFVFESSLKRHVQKKHLKTETASYDGNICATP